MIAASGLRKRFGARDALDDISFEVEPGQVVGLLGPNGAGKTTALRILLGLTRADGGTCTVPDRVGYLPEDHVGYPAMTVAGYLGYLGQAKSVPRPDLPSEIDRVASLLDLDELVRRPLGRLSKGQRQRVGIAQALLGEPPAYVFDEPTTGLDPGQRAAVRQILTDLAADGAAVLLSTHLLAEAAAVCDRLVVIARGRVVAVEEPGEPGDLEERFLRLVAEAELS